VLIPVIAGLVLRLLLDRYAPTAAKAGLSVFPAISVIAIVAIVAAVVGLNVEEILTASALVVAAVVLHNGLGLGAGYGVGKLTGMDRGSRPGLCLRGRPPEQRTGSRARGRLLRSDRGADPGAVQRLAQRERPGAGDVLHPQRRGAGHRVRAGGRRRLTS